MIAWKRKSTWYAGTIKFILGIPSPALHVVAYELKPGDRINGRKITAVVMV